MAINNDSILNTTKKILGLDVSYTIFDLDVVTHINTVLSNLEQLGVGPQGGLFIADHETTWADLIGVDPRLNLVKTYVFLRVRLLFDPPTTSFAIAAMEKQVQEMEWRLTVAADELKDALLIPST